MVALVAVKVSELSVERLLPMKECPVRFMKVRMKGKE